MPLSIKVMISSMVAQIHQFLEVIVLACSAITEIYLVLYFGNSWKLFSYIDEHTVDKCMNCYALCYQI